MWSVMNRSVMKDKNDERKYIIAPFISNQRKLDKIQTQKFLLRWLCLMLVIQINII